MQFFLFSSRCPETTTAKKRLHVTRVIRWETRLRRVQSKAMAGEMKALCGNSSGNRSKRWKQKKRADKKKRILGRSDEESPRGSVIKTFPTSNVFCVLAQLLGIYFFLRKRNILVPCSESHRHANRPFADGCSTRRELLASSCRADCEISNSVEILWQAECDGSGRADFAVQLFVANPFWRGRSNDHSSQHQRHSGRRCLARWPA